MWRLSEQWPWRPRPRGVQTKPGHKHEGNLASDTTDVCNCNWSELNKREMQNYIIIL